MESETNNLLPLLAPELLTATATGDGERLGSNEAWNAVFGTDEMWAALTPEDRRFANEYLAEAATGSLVTHQVFLVDRHGRDLSAPVLLNFLPVHVPDAAVGKLLVTVTGEVLQEPKQWTNDQTKRRRMEVLGQMSMGIAHDFNNLLTSIIGHVELLKAALDVRGDGVVSVESLSSQLRTVERAALDGAALVRKIQRYIRHENKQRFETLDLAAIVDEVASLTRPYWHNEPRRQGIDIDLVKELDEVPPTRGAEAEVREVLVNLILNAVQAMPDGGTLILRAYRDGPLTVAAEVSDTGVGITPTTKKRIFEPLFTTKGENGSGMGLAVSYGVMQEHNGSIEVLSEPGEGTRFILRFPIQTADQTEKPQPATVPAPTAGRTSANILVVDDEKMVRGVTTKLLRLRGHRVEEAPGGAEALERIASHPFDLIVTDLGMPNMSGSELAYRIRQHHPHLPIILLTGHTDADDQSEHVDVVVKKPFQIDALEATIQRVLAGK